MSEKETKQHNIPYLTGYVQFQDGTTAKVVLWHNKPRNKEATKTKEGDGHV